MYRMNIDNDLKDIPIMFVQYRRRGVVYSTQLRANAAYWKYKAPDGTISGVPIGNAPHPMEHINLLPRIDLPAGVSTISFDFTVKPSSFTVRYWPDSYAGIEEAYDVMYETLKVNGRSVQIPRSRQGLVFQVHGMWPRGNAYYEFYVIPSIRFSQALK